MLHDKKKLKEKFRFKNCNFRLSWFIIYSVFVLLLSAVGVILLFTLQMFQHTHFLPIFLLVVLYSFSIIMFAFMITPFFDKSRVSIPLILFCYFCVFFFFLLNYFCLFFYQTAGVLGNFAVTIMSLMYFIQVFINDSSSVPFWLVSLLSPTGVALAMDKVCITIRSSKTRVVLIKEKEILRIKNFVGSCTRSTRRGSQL